MSCIFFSKSKDLDLYFWKDFDTRTNIGMGSGYFTRYNNKYFILTCFHNLNDNNVENTVYYFDKNTNSVSTAEAKLYFYFKELDIAILECMFDYSNIPDNIDFYDYKTYEYKKLNQYDELYFDELKIDYQDVNLTKNIKKMIYEKSEYSYLSPHIDKSRIVKYFRAKMIEESDYNDVHGKSGSLVFSNKIPVGIITCFVKSNGEKYIELLPFVFIFEILNLGLENSKFKNIQMKYECVCEIELDETTKVQDELKNEIKRDITYFGLMIEDKLFCYRNCSENNKKIPFNFKKEDVIMKVNDDYISSNGTIYYKQMDENISFFQYLMFNTFDKNKDINIIFCRNNKITSINITSKNFSFKPTKFHALKSDSYINHNGLIFTEVSNKLLDLASDEKIVFPTNIIDVKTCNKFVVLININNPEYKDIICNNDIIISCDKNIPSYKNNMLIVSKVGNKFVTDLNSLDNLLKNTNSGITFNFPKQNSQHIEFELQKRNIKIFY